MHHPLPCCSIPSAPSRLLGLLLLGLMLLLGISAPIPAQPLVVGSELQVNTFTTGDQRRPAVAKNDDGFVMVWQDDAGFDGDGDGIRGQLYALDGTPRGGEFQVNAYTTADQSWPDVTMVPDGGFMVVWMGQGTGDDDGIHGRRFNSSGSALGGDLLINDATTDSQRLARIASNADGFVVVWQSDSNIIGRRMDSAGITLDGDFQVNTNTYEQYYPAIDMNASGQFTVVWEGPIGLLEGYAVVARRFGSDGAAIGAQFQVSTDSEYQYFPDVALDADGDFVVVWWNYNAVYSPIVARKVTSGGVLTGTEFQVNTSTNYPYSPAIDMSPEGQFLIVWDEIEPIMRRSQSEGMDSKGMDSKGMVGVMEMRNVLGRRYLEDGTALGDEFQVNAFTTAAGAGFQRLGVAMDSSNEVVVGWTAGHVETDHGPDGEDGAIRAAVLHFCTGAPAMDDADGDGYYDFCDICPGFDDAVDIDMDGVPDGCDDFEPPTVTAVSSTPDTGDDSLEECEEARQPLTHIQITFSEAMAEPDVTTTEAYVVVAAGGDGNLDSTGCFAIDPGDPTISVVGVTYDAPSHTATLELPLDADDQYRLMVCDSLTDEEGNALDVDFIRDFRIEAENLFTGGHFDCDLSGWTEDPASSPNIDHASDDAPGGNVSGSARFSNPGNAGLALDQCAEISPVGLAKATSFDLTSSVQVAGDPEDLVIVRRDCEIFAAAGCSGDVLSSFAAADQIVLDTSGTWLTFEDSLSMPATATSARCRFEFTSPDTSPVVLLDEVTLKGGTAGSEDLFADGFESGDTLAWN